MKKIVKDVLGYVSLVLVLPFIVPAGLVVMAGLYVAQLLIRLVGGGNNEGTEKKATEPVAENDKWSGVSAPLSWNCLNI